MMPASRHTAIRDVLVVWTEGYWRCELQTGGIRDEGRILVYLGERIVTAESVHLGAAAYSRAEILHQRLLRGDLRAPE
jgi:hypothetical protein